VGLANLLFWRGLDEEAAAHALFALLPVAVAMLWLFSLRRVRGERAAPALLAGAFALLGLVTARAASPASLAIPLTLIALGGILPEREPSM
jgi:hypothetical protein